MTGEASIMRRFLWALTFGVAGGALFFAGMTLLAISLPTTENDPFIIGAGAVLAGLVAAGSIIFRK
jgi:hypothetical protein